MFSTRCSVLGAEVAPCGCGQEISCCMFLDVKSTTLDDLTLSSSLTAPKLDLLPLKADIGDIMMAGEDSSEDDT